MILRVQLEMFSEVIDALAEDGDLNLGRTGVTFMLAVQLMRSVFLSFVSATTEPSTHGRGRSATTAVYGDRRSPKDPLSYRTRLGESYGRSTTMADAPGKTTAGCKNPTIFAASARPTSLPSGDSRRTSDRLRGSASGVPPQSSGRKILAVRRAPQAVDGQGYGRQVRQQRVHRDDPRAHPFERPRHDVGQGHGHMERKAAGTRAHKFLQDRPRAQRASQVMRQRSHVKTGGRDQTQTRHRRLEAEKVQRMRDNANGVERDRLRLPRQTVGPIAVNFLGRIERRYLIKGAAKLRERGDEIVARRGFGRTPRRSGRHCRRCRSRRQIARSLRTPSRRR